MESNYYHQPFANKTRFSNTTVRRQSLWYVGFMAACLVLSACSNVHVEDEREIRAMPPTASKAIYVTDFELAARTFRAESGVRPISPMYPGVAGMFITRLLEMPEDRASRARELINLMSSTLVGDLTDAGLNARRLPAGELLPSEGWLVRGVFVQLDEGNRLRRALIGFGSGATKLKVIVWVSDLARGSASFCELDASTHSSKGPGAAISFAPYVGAARFVLDGLDLDTNVMQTAAKIADDIAERSRTGRPPHNWQTELKRFL
jgi:hypothetical protein